MSGFTPSTALFGQMARFIAAGRGDPVQSLALAEAQKADPKVINILKAAVSGHSTNDPGFGTSSSDYRAVASGFVELLRSRSAFYQLLENGSFSRVPLRTRLSLVTGGATGNIVPEGSAAPVSSMQLANSTLDPVKAVALVVMSDEVLKVGNPGSQAMVSRELRNAVANVVDTTFLTLIDGVDVTSVVATANPLTDVRALLTAVATTGSENLVFLASVDVAIAASTHVNSGGVATFPNMGVSGGTMLGIPAVVSTAVPAGTLMLLDASAVAANSDTILLAVSDSAALQMDDAPTGDSVTPTATNLVSLYAENKIALKATAFFGVERYRSGSLAELTAVGW